MTTSLASSRLTTGNNFSQGGNGKYKPLRTRNTSAATKPAGFDPFDPSYDRMHFKTTRDPIFIAFEHIEKQSPLKLTTDLIKDGITDSINTIGKRLVKLFN